MSKMDVLAFVDERKCEVRSVAKPVPKENQVLIKVTGCALCTFEQRIFVREVPLPLPFVGGHEIAGVIEELGPGVKPEKFPIGKKTAVLLMTRCGKCYYCRHGREELCESINDFDESAEIPGMGGLSQYIAVDTQKVWLLPDDMATETAVFAEPLACVLNSIERAHPEIGDDVVVIGGGIMGMLHVMCAKLSGCRVILSEPDPVRRKIAEELGCDITINPIETDPVKFIKDLNGYGASVVFNTTPISAVVKQAIEMTADMGRCVMYSSQHPDKPVEVSPNKMHKSEKIITGAVNPSVVSFDRSVSLLSKKLLDPSKLLSGSFDYHEGMAAFEMAIRPDTYRILVTF